MIFDNLADRRLFQAHYRLWFRRSKGSQAHFIGVFRVGGGVSARPAPVKAAEGPDPARAYIALRRARSLRQGRDHVVAPNAITLTSARVACLKGAQQSCHDFHSAADWRVPLVHATGRTLSFPRRSKSIPTSTAGTAHTAHPAA